MSDLQMPQQVQNALRQGAGDAALAMMLASLRQTMLDVGGEYPASNVMPYSYAFTTTLDADSSGTASIRITADAAFIARFVTGTSDGSYTILPRVDASDRQLSNVALNDTLFVGTAERPFPLGKPLLLPANSTISFDLADLSSAENKIYFSLHGYKVYGTL
jgi:hypothetical protein